ncbi:MAG TPA: hypothetical protein VGP18_08265 [Solirubrobacteraceae bacterium]|nr:hypothetical protein [Solirubrobacteraceae bacterium]
MTDDETQHSSPGYALGKVLRPRTWVRWLAATYRRAVPADQDRQTSDRFSVRETLCALPTLLDSSSLPDGVVELLIEDFEAPITRQLFDIHEGHIKSVEPGQCVPWTSIAGSLTAWAMALGPERDAAQLQLTGDEQLARCVLAALPQRP